MAAVLNPMPAEGRGVPRRRRDGWIWLAWTIGLLALFNVWPDLDLAFSAAVHRHPDLPGRFPWGQALAVQAVYQIVPWVGRVGLLIVLALVLLPRTAPRWRRRSMAMLLMLVIGLWLVIHVGLKDQWGRPRPTEVTAFGGVRGFVPAGRPASACERNCSFVSGHAATGFALSAFGLTGSPATRRRWLRIGWGAGLAIGAGRVLQGGHFLSDIVFAGLVMHGAGLALRRAWVVWRGTAIARAPWRGAGRS